MISNATPVATPFISAQPKLDVLVPQSITQSQFSAVKRFTQVNHMPTYRATTSTPPE